MRVTARAASRTEAGIMLAQVAPASATVHEIVGQWCSGQEPLGPPGISGGKSGRQLRAAAGRVRLQHGCRAIPGRIPRPVQRRQPALESGRNWCVRGDRPDRRDAALPRTDRTRPLVPGLPAPPAPGDRLTASTLRGRSESVEDAVEHPEELLGREVHRDGRRRVRGPGIGLGRERVECCTPCRDTFGFRGRGVGPAEFGDFERDGGRQRTKKSAHPVFAQVFGITNS